LEKIKVTISYYTVKRSDRHYSMSPLYQNHNVSIKHFALIYNPISDYGVQHISEHCNNGRLSSLTYGIFKRSW